ncbi:type II secretion system F family protein [Wenyingzhuangia sp. chi5]|uniref:Type II secretion system F family protein n=1 Tax=Wenyingzhuangia gilva TaxID=3057677 RepID=A0ABT8VSH3_9FLAO|nr:type II secretion system F family protein [Wenyingzhuangia sp. chi5]MDO3694919.1 type II secretion system F family protein [Wenyingzhuangia sp. chi5]
MAFKLTPTSQQKTVIKENVDQLSFLKKEIHFFNQAFSNKIKEDFYTELSVLLKAGVSLKDGLELIENSLNKEYNKKILQEIAHDVVMGQTLSTAFKKHKPFTDYEFYSVKIGEETGTLSKVCEQLGCFFFKKNEQRRNLISALTYPFIILTTAVLVVIFMLQYVVPMFQDIFKQQGVTLPTITKIIIKVSEFIDHYGLFILIFLVLGISFQSFLTKRKRFKQFRDKFLLKLPFIGHFIKVIYLAQFTQAVALLVSSKVPMINSIQLVKQMIPFYPLQEALQTVEEHILKGASLSNSLKEHELFDRKMIALVKVAEETNQTEYIFERLHTQYSTQVEQQSKMLSTVMEPFIILIVGVLVGVILIAMYLPMFKLSSVIG